MKRTREEAEAEAAEGTDASGALEADVEASSVTPELGDSKPKSRRQRSYKERWATASNQQATEIGNNISHSSELLNEKDAEKEPERGPQAKAAGYFPPKSGSAAFPYGNYLDYYGYRHLNSSTEFDARVEALASSQRVSAALNRDAHCLDIGCNSGVFTLDLVPIVKRFQIGQMLGLDLDSRLISKAKGNLTKVKKLNNSDPNLTFKLDRVTFERLDFVPDPVPRGPFDVVFCMSVIKWIHVNHGDAAVTAAFQKVHSLLHPGGLFVLEPQPWTSYKKKKLSPEARKIFDQIQIRPDAFPPLIESLGFTLTERLTAGGDGDEGGVAQPGNFKDREILIFKRT